MSYRVEVENRAARQILTLPCNVRDRVIRLIERLQIDPRPTGCTKLKGQSKPAWRVRVGEYRVLYRISDDEKVVRIYGVLRRDEAYR